MKRDNSYLIGNQFAKGNVPNQTAFQKGSTPWNKGIRQITSEKCLATAFRKGGKPHNAVAIGTVTIRTDKNGKRRRWIKVGEKRWLPFAQWAWEKTYGPIPKYLIIHHRDGKTLNDFPSNYCLVTRGEHINLHRKDLRNGKH
jgi:hypothetical protein